MSGEPIRVFVVDDHEVVRLGLRAFLGTTPGVELIGVAADGRTALAELDALAERDALPDMVLMDLVMPEPDGVATTALVKKAPRPWTSSWSPASEGAPRPRCAGGGRYRLRAQGRERRGDRRGHPGGAPWEVHLDAAVARVLTRSLVAPRRGVTALTGREREVLALVAEGRSNHDIGRMLSIGERSARCETHLGNVLAKLELTSRTQAALWAVREGLVRP